MLCGLVSGPGGLYKRELLFGWGKHALKLQASAIVTMPALADITTGWYTPFLCAGLAIGAILLGFIWLVVPRSSIRHLQGPPPQSWFLGEVNDDTRWCLRRLTDNPGNMRELETSAVGDCEFRWMERYGMSYTLSGGFGVRFPCVPTNCTVHHYSSWLSQIYS
jgi:hypothetical protein